MRIKSELSNFNKYLPALFAILVILLRLPYIDSEPASLDEPFTLYWAQKSISDIFQLAYNENNPPLHFLILHFWMKLFGTSAFSWRLPSLLFSAALTFLGVVQAGKKSIYSALITGILFTFSTQQIFFSLEA
ncbi:MAG: glycosyltransferase family 39 protein, partial [Bacteroidetes bacterium]|nr:glycosyltransferase family 39 protein [Bacteroidota bacterium]